MICYWFVDWAAKINPGKVTIKSPICCHFLKIPYDTDRFFFSAWISFARKSAIRFYEIYCCISKFVLFCVLVNLKWIECFAFFKFLDGDTQHIHKVFSLFFLANDKTWEPKNIAHFYKQFLELFLIVKHYLKIWWEIIWVKNLWYLMFYSGVFEYVSFLYH